MCLGHIDLVKKGLSRTVFIGYKVFQIPKRYELDGLYFQYQYHAGTKKVPFDKWLTAKQILMWGNNGYYTTGFHVYKYQQDAWDIAWSVGERVVKVKYKGILAEGKEIGREVVVVRYMYVPHWRKKRRKEGVRSVCLNYQ